MTLLTIVERGLRQSSTCWANFPQAFSDLKRLPFIRPGFLVHPALSCD
jgi:hypothetical protein